MRMFVGMTAAVMLSASVGSAAPLPVASLTSTGTVSYNATDGLTGSGTLEALYRQPAPGKIPYIFSKKVALGPVTVTPNVTLGYEAFEEPNPLYNPNSWLPPILNPETITVPGASFTLDVPIPVLPAVTFFDKSFVSSALPAGDVLAFDFGSILLGQPLSFGALVQDQFETGATTVNKSGAIGPFDLSFNYDGALSGNTIDASFDFGASSSGLFSDIETFMLGIVNDNIDLVFDIAFSALRAGNFCTGVAAIVCETIEGLPKDNVIFSVNGISNFTADFHVDKSIAPIPVPFALPLLATGFGLMGMVRLRRRAAAA